MCWAAVHDVHTCGVVAVGFVDVRSCTQSLAAALILCDPCAPFTHSLGLCYLDCFKSAFCQPVDAGVRRWLAGRLCCHGGICVPTIYMHHVVVVAATTSEKVLLYQATAFSCALLCQAHHTRPPSPKLRGDTV
jgi:hypothetical protein